MSDNQPEKPADRPGRDEDSVHVSTLLPMLVGGLILIVVSMIVVMTFE